MSFVSRGATTRESTRRSTFEREEAGRVGIVCRCRHSPSLPSPTLTAPSSLLLAVFLVHLLLLLSDRIEAFAIPAAIRNRRRSVTRTTMTQVPQLRDCEKLSTRAHTLFHNAAAVTGGLLLGSAISSIGGITKAQAALDPIVSQTYMEQVRDGTLLVLISPLAFPPSLPPPPRVPVSKFSTFLSCSKPFYCYIPF